MEHVKRIPAIEAHRGDSSRAPENTLAAFEGAVRLKAPWIELDVHPAKDGTLMVMHDDTLDRTTTGKGPLNGKTAGELARLDAGAWFGPPFAGERIPRLEDVLARVAPTGTRLNVEIKSPPPGFDVAHAVAGLLRRFGQARVYVVSSFDLPVLLQVKALAPEISLALIGKGPEILPLALKNRLAWIHAHHPTMTPEIVAEAHRGGLGVNVWTVDDPATLPSWVAMKVDKICTNRPADLLEAAAAYRA